MGAKERAADRAADGGQYMQIGEVAQRTGLTQRALRYYESLGLLQPPTRMEGGFRLYSEPDVERLDRIVELKRLLGFSLAEIRQVIEADDLLRQIKTETKHQPDARARRAGLERAIGVISNQLALVRSRIESMRDLHAHYERRLERLRGRIATIDETLAAEESREAEHVGQPA
ncbi:MAG TPA: MerR family transcriptional regulator [Chloroflexota bacterium]|nr:MerR family transcriptional regulator [Chloroflexota bacterium]